MDAMTDRPHALRPETRPFSWMPAAALVLAVAATMALAPYPPLQDFAEWAYQGEVLARLLRSLPTPEVTLVTHPVPNSLAQAVLALLALLMPATIAARVFVLGLLAGGLALSLALARRFQPAAPGAFAVVLVVSFLCNTTFWNGYVNYQLGLLLFGAWFLLRPARRLDAGPVLAFGLATFLSHAAVFAAFGLVVGLEALAARRWRGALVGLAPAAALGIWYVLAAPTGNQPTSGTGSLPRFLAYKAYTLTKLGPYHNFVFARGGDEALLPLAYRAGMLANLAYVAILLGALGWGGRQALRGRAPPAGLVAAAALLLVLFLVLPANTRSIINPGERLLIPALLLLCLLVRLPAAALRVAAGLGGTVLAANLLVLALPGRDWSAPVHFRDLEASGSAGALFRHRPTSFACKWEALRAGGATGAPPAVPISFQTSLLRSPGEDYFCPAPDDADTRIGR